MATNGINYSQASGLTISTNSTQRVIVTTGGTSTFTGITYGSKIIESVGTQGNLFSVYDDLTGDILAVTNSGGGTIFAVNAYDPVRISGLTESTTSNNYLVIQPNGVVKYKTILLNQSGLSGLGGSGVSGLLGISGISGISGRSGISGISGVSGISGISGLSGTSGTSGVSGIVGGGLSWTYSTTGQTGIVNYGFISTASTLSTITLPATATLGSTIEVTGIGTGAWKIGQLANHQIHFGVINTTSGATGYLQSTQTYDSIRLLCTTKDNEYTVLTVMGNITVI